MLGGAIRVTTPFLFVALGEMLTERSGRINLGLEGTLVLGAMTAYAFSFQTGSPWAGVLAAGCFGFLMGGLHATICRLPGVNDIAVGIALMLFGTGLAFFFGKPYIQPTAPRLPSLPLGDWTGDARIAQALQINPLFLIGVALAFFLAWALKNTRAGLILRVRRQRGRGAGVGPPGDADPPAGDGGRRFLAGIGGAFLSLYYPAVGTRGCPPARA